MHDTENYKQNYHNMSRVTRVQLQHHCIFIEYNNVFLSSVGAKIKYQIAWIRYHKQEYLLSPP